MKPPRLIALIVAATVTAAAACAHGESPRGAPSEETVLSLQDIACQSCGEAVVGILERERAVHRAAFDMHAVEVTVTYDPAQTNPEALAHLVTGAGYQAVVGPGQGRYAAAVEFPEALDLAWISRGGEMVDIHAHLAADKVTVFDFFAEWCGPCREVDREMRAILETHDDVALRKLDVSDWDWPVAEHYLRRVPALPYVIVYDPSGNRVAAISGLDLEALRAAISRAREDTD